LNAAVPVEALLAALGIAMSPLSVAAVILALLSSRSKVVGAAYAAGWTLGITVVGVLLLFLGDQLLGGANGPSQALVVVKLLLGLGLIGLGGWQLAGMRGAQGPAEEPKWKRLLDDLAPPRAFVFAAVWGALQPKNLTLLAAGMLALSQSGLDPAAVWAMFAAFVIVASTSVLAIVGYYLLAGGRADERLDIWERWLARYGPALVGGFLGVLGAVLVVDAVSALLG